MMRRLAIAALVLTAACNGGRDEEPSIIPEDAPPTTPTAAGVPGPEAMPTATTLPPGVLAALEVISAADMRAVVAELSSDAYGGRDPGTEGDEKARRYLAERLEQLGFAPGAGDGYQQPFDLVGITASQPEAWTFRRGDETRDLERREEFIVSSGAQSESVSMQDAELVFVGYGIQAPEYQWDDFGGADLEGKVLVMLNNDPDWDPDLFEGERRLYYGRWTYKYESAARQGAAGAIIIHTTASAGYPWQVVETSWSGTQFELPQGDEPRLQVKAWLTGDAAASLMEWAGQDLEALTEAARRRDFEPVPLAVTTSLSLDNEITNVQTANVLGCSRAAIRSYRRRW